MTTKERIQSLSGKLNILGIPFKQAKDWVLLEQYENGKAQSVINCSVINGEISRVYDARVTVSEHIAACEYFEKSRHIVDIICYGISGVVESIDITEGLGIEKLYELNGYEIFILRKINLHKSLEFAAFEYVIVSVLGKVLKFNWAGKDRPQLSIGDNICKMSCGNILHMTFNILTLKIMWKSNTTWLTIIE